MRIAPAITLSSDQQTTLEQWARSRLFPARVVERARIVLLAAQGRQDKEIASRLKITQRRHRGGASDSLRWGWQGWSAMRRDRAELPNLPPVWCGGLCT